MKNSFYVILLIHFKFLNRYLRHYFDIFNSCATSGGTPLGGENFDEQVRELEECRKFLTEMRVHFPKLTIDRCSEVPLNDRRRRKVLLPIQESINRSIKAIIDLVNEMRLTFSEDYSLFTHVTSTDLLESDFGTIQNVAGK